MPPPQDGAPPNPKIADQVDTYPNGVFAHFHGILTFCHREVNLEPAVGPVADCGLFMWDTTTSTFSKP
jgi:hypothetical protein